MALKGGHRNKYYEAWGRSEACYRHGGFIIELLKLLLCTPPGFHSKTTPVNAWNFTGVKEEDGRRSQENARSIQGKTTL